MTKQITLTNTTAAARSGRRGRLTARAALVGGVALLGLGVSVGTADAATGTTGLHYRSNATCKPIASPVQASSDIVSVAAPVIYAANTSSMLDGQTVSFRQRLVRWNGTSWVATNQYSAVWSGFATDATAALDFSDGTRTVRQPAFDFTAAPGYYAVVTDYWWGATNRSSGGSNVATAYHSPAANNLYCGFIY